MTKPLPTLPDGRVLVDCFSDYDQEDSYTLAATRNVPDNATRVAVPYDVWERFVRADEARTTSIAELDGAPRFNSTETKRALGLAPFTTVPSPE